MEKIQQDEDRNKQLERLPRESITSLFEYLGNFFGCERIYIFEKNNVGGYNCTQEWCSEDVYPKKDILQNLSWKDVQYYYRYFQKHKNLVVRDIKELKKDNPDLYEILEPDGLCSVLAGQLIYEGEDYGFMGIDNPNVALLDELAIVFEVLGYYVASQLHSIRLIDHLERIGYQDRLTGCGNRHALYERTGRLEAGSAVGIISLDILRTKDMNKNQERIEEDEFFIYISRVMIELFGQQQVFRLSEDEFLILCENLSEQEIGEKQRDLYEKLHLESIDIIIEMVYCNQYKGNFSELIEQVEVKRYDSKQRYHMQGTTKLLSHNVQGFNELIEIHPQSDFYRLIYSDYVQDKGMQGRFYESVRMLEETRIHPLDRLNFHNLWEKTRHPQEMLRQGKNVTLTGTFRVHTSKNDWAYIKVEIIAFEDIYNAPVLMCFIKNVPMDNIKDDRMVCSMEEESLTQSQTFFHDVDIWIQHARPDYIVTMAVDLNNFKLYNDIFGWDAGDEYLALLKNELAKIAKARNGAWNYMGGDNFCLILTFQKMSSADITKKIREMVEGVIQKVDFKDGFMPCVGISISCNSDEYQSMRYDHALVALSSVVGNFTERIAFYDAVSYEKIRHTHMLLMDAPKGIQNGEFIFYLQPKVDLQTEAVIGSEALVRWKRQGKIVPPGEFIEAMEQNGYIAAIDRYVWEEVCKWLNKLAAGQGIEPLPVSVNVSRVDIHFIDIEECFIELAEKYVIKPEWLEIEITESAYVENEEKLRETLSHLRKCGFRILLDDFGSGYSSLTTLQDMEVDVIKLDQKFLLKGEHNPKHQKVMKSIFDMAKMLETEVIVEGVETKEHCELLLDLKQRYCQGFYFYKPLPVEEFEELVYTK